MKEEYKLIFLTLLVRLGLGMLVVFILTSFLVPSVKEYIVALAALAVTACGLGLSLLHVGRPIRILNTFANRRSAMSWEAIISPFLLLAIGALTLISFSNPENRWIGLLRGVVLILAVAFIFVTGKVYHLRARPSWNTTLVMFEYFVSAVVLGILGFALVLVATGSMTEEFSRLSGFLLVPFLIAETVIAYAYRARAIRVTETARKALEERATKRLFAWFVALGLMLPTALALMLAIGSRVQAVVPIALGAFLLGAVWWRIIFFRSATLIKITPDIVI